MTSLRAGSRRTSSNVRPSGSTSGIIGGCSHDNALHLNALCDVRARQPETEARAAARLRFHPHVAAVIQHRLPRERQPQPQPVALAGADEGLEQLRADLRRDAGPVVFHVHHYRPRSDIRVNAHLARPGIASSALPIRFTKARSMRLRSSGSSISGGISSVQHDALRLRRRRQRIRRSRRHFAQPAHLRRAALPARNVQQILHSSCMRRDAR